MITMLYAAGTHGMLVLVAGLCLAQLPSRFVEIELPAGMDSATVFARYYLSGIGVGGLVQPRAGVTSYPVATTRDGHVATRFQALVYAPGCALETINLVLSAQNDPQAPFVCRPLPTVRLTGVVERPNQFDGRKIKVRAKYVARWAQALLNAVDAVTIPVGEAELSADSRFSLTLPDFSKDPLAGVDEYPGEIQIWAGDVTTGDLVAQLVLSDETPLRTRMGGLNIQGAYPAMARFTPCAVNRNPVYDAEGFAVRPAHYEACER